MARKAYARRYAQAVFEIALEQNELERWQTDLKKIAGATGDPILLAALESPRLKIEDKTRLLTTTLGDVSSLALNLVLLLITKGGAGILGDISGEYNRLLNSYRGIEPAEVTTAVPIDEKDVQKLSERLGELIGKKVEVKSEVDPDIIGGIIARVGGKLLDGSTRSRLVALKRELAEAGR